ncbi:Hypothetical protein GLP15_1825 [Giardia lamblia P15]|uniref:Uncharacterized protein n=1 Tax=Giardia intestinalis (strain P15) TaxID=658858 RepID=E1EYJ8_GIAIA|nr:Hypothetical protein GLP15_1825 [Giardia lamblia P15]
MGPQFWQGTNLSCTMVNMARLQGGNFFLSAINLLCNAILEAPSTNTAQYLQGLSLCLVVDFIASAPRTDHNTLHFVQGLEILTNGMKRSIYFNSQILEECLKAADRYLSSPVVYISPESDSFKQLIRYFLAELQDACLHTPQRAALLVDKLLACYLDMQSSSSKFPNTVSGTQLKVWILMLLSASKLFLRYKIVSVDRLLYIRDLLAINQPNLRCSNLTRSVTRFITAIPIKGNSICPRRRRRLLTILRKVIHSAMRSCKSESLKLDLSLCSFPTSGQLPFTQPCCAIPHFQESFNRFRYMPTMVSAVTRADSNRLLLSPFTRAIKEPPTSTIYCENIPHFMTKEEFYNKFTNHFLVDSLLSITAFSYAMSNTQTHTASVSLCIDAESVNTDIGLAVFNSAVNKLVEAPELIVWGHAIKVTVALNQAS